MVFNVYSLKGLVAPENFIKKLVTSPQTPVAHSRETVQSLAASSSDPPLVIEKYEVLRDKK